MDKNLKITFAPGCFDSFEGTQEELDALIKEITEGFQNGDFLENAKRVDIDELIDEDPELARKLAASFDLEEAEQQRKNNLQ